MQVSRVFKVIMEQQVLLVLKVQQVLMAITATPEIPVPLEQTEPTVRTVRLEILVLLDLKVT